MKKEREEENSKTAAKDAAFLKVGAPKRKELFLEKETENARFYENQTKPKNFQTDNSE